MPMNHSKRRHGMTLLELLIAMTGMIFVGGAALKIYEETQGAAVKMTRRQVALDYASRVMDEIAARLRDSIPPSELAPPHATSRMDFKSDHLVFPTMFADSKTTGAHLMSLGPTSKAGVMNSIVSLRSASNANVTEVSSPMGGIPEGFTPQLEFAYATDANPDRAINYRDSLSQNEWPLLVRVKLRIDIAEYPTDPIVLQTAVLMGRITRSGSPQT